MTEPHNIIDEILTDDCENKIVYHYTSADGLLGIVNNTTIRCSHSYFLNDFEENLNGWKLFLRTLEKYEKEGEYFSNFKQTIRQYFKHWIDLDLENLSYEIFNKVQISKYRSFVFSASYKKDDLNQWRSYTPDSSGYSIGLRIDSSFKKRQDLFRDKSPEDSLNLNNCKILIKNCIYNDSDKEEKCIKLLDYHYNQFVEGLSNNWVNDLFFNILSLSLYFKNHKFIDEKECRIVVLPIGDRLTNLFREDVNILKFRSGKNMIIPYVELDLHPDNFENIVIGPTPNKYHARESVDMFIKSHIFGKEIIIENSDIPYRTW